MCDSSASTRVSAARLRRREVVSARCWIPRHWGEGGPEWGWGDLRGDQPPSLGCGVGLTGWSRRVRWCAHLFPLQLKCPGVEGQDGTHILTIVAWRNLSWNQGKLKCGNLFWQLDHRPRQPLHLSHVPPAFSNDATHLITRSVCLFNTDGTQSTEPKQTQKDEIFTWADGTRISTVSRTSSAPELKPWQAFWNQHFSCKDVLLRFAAEVWWGLRCFAKPPLWVSQISGTGLSIGTPALRRLSPC